MYCHKYIGIVIHVLYYENVIKSLQITVFIVVYMLDYFVYWTTTHVVRPAVLLYANVGYHSFAITILSCRLCKYKSRIVFQRQSVIIIISFQCLVSAYI